MVSGIPAQLVSHIRPGGPDCGLGVICPLLSSFLVLSHSLFFGVATTSTPKETKKERMRAMYFT